MREAAKLQKELEEQRKRVEKEQTHYQTALQKVHQQLQMSPNNQDLLQKRRELEVHLTEIDNALHDIDYRTANQRAGYVYIISNIGSFGENIYKIGMTRRLDPQDRVDELGDASVPFNFDVHAMIFSNDAPALEAALHRAFENRKLNMVNHRREFFHVTLDEIKAVVKTNFDKTVEFIDIPDAEQFRVSEQIRNQDPSCIPLKSRVSPNYSNQSPIKKPKTATQPTHTPTSIMPMPSNVEVLRTKWGVYEMPAQYHICLTKGPRNDLKLIRQY